jgi:hypothetical protein
MLRHLFVKEVELRRLEGFVINPLIYRSAPFRAGFVSFNGRLTT